MNSFTSKMNVSKTAISTTPIPYCYYKGITGSRPSLILEYSNSELSIRHAEKNMSLGLNPLQALEFISDLIANLKTPEFDSDPPKNTHFKYGLMGFFSFEYGLKLLDIHISKQIKNLPDFYFILPTEFDIEGFRYKVLNEKPVFETPNNQINQEAEEGSNMSKTEYAKKLDKIKKLLIDGETYQVNFAQQFNAQTKQQPEAIFNALESLNPSPESSILKTANFSIVSNSPECLFSKTKNEISTFPIKGTISSTENPKKLLDSKKDQAELEMIVDLERNDLGKIAIPGTVKVKNHRYIQTLNNIHHTVSEITAQLPTKTTFKEIILSLFPGGSVTGCPKISTCEIIHNLEPTARGAYCGSLGYIDIDGNSRFNILIRSLLQVGLNATFYAGGGITINSNTNAEFEESLQKASNIKKVLSK